MKLGNIHYTKGIAPIVTHLSVEIENTDLPKVDNRLDRLYRGAVEILLEGSVLEKLVVCDHLFEFADRDVVIIFAFDFVVEFRPSRVLIVIAES